tara:strand:- start:479 stop:631 length:153 start_codon:yes stop_codon:yes gene_type:complete
MNERKELIKTLKTIIAIKNRERIRLLEEKQELERIVEKLESASSNQTELF